MAASPPPTEPTCPFCAGQIAERSVSGTGYTIWESECTAIGSGSPMRPDLDEVAEGLLACIASISSAERASIRRAELCRS
jgi:hypothetical protein